MGNDRYLKAYLYNMVRVANRLAEMVAEAGGEVRYPNKETLRIHSRGYDDEYHRATEALEKVRREYRRCEACGETRYQEARKEAIRRFEEEVRVIEEKISMTPVIETRFVSLTSDVWVRFTLDGFRYYIEFDSNPFFPDYYSKTKAGHKEHPGEIRLEKKAYLLDDLLQPVSKDETVENSASLILKCLIDAEES